MSKVVMAGKYSLFVLELQGGRFFVGKTTSLDYTINQHKKGKASKWTRRFQLIQVLECKEYFSWENIYEIEMRQTVQLMWSMGLNCVRGGKFQESRYYYTVKDYELIFKEYQKYLPFSEITLKSEIDNELSKACEDIQAKMQTYKDGCFRCRTVGHWGSECMFFRDGFMFEIE